MDRQFDTEKEKEKEKENDEVELTPEVDFHLSSSKWSFFFAWLADGKQTARICSSPSLFRSRPLYKIKYVFAVGVKKLEKNNFSYNSKKIYVRVKFL